MGILQKLFGQPKPGKPKVTFTITENVASPITTLKPRKLLG
jgi:hypothetical protein